MNARRRQRGRRLMAVLALGVALTLANARGWLGPVKAAVGWLVGPIGSVAGRAGSTSGGFMRTFTQIGSLSSDNARLRADNAALRAQITEAQALRRQNEALRSQIGLAPAEKSALIAAEVIAYQPDNFRQFLTISLGSSSAVAVGQAVVAQGLLVGKISEVTGRTAKVFLASDPEFRATAMDQETGAMGTVRGQIGQGFVMDKIAQNEEIKPGDTIVTSGLGGELPKGLIIGRVESVNSRDNAVFQVALLSSEVTFSRLELVFVVPAE